MTYIVLDLEWNQAASKEEEVPGITFEIIEIGAVKLDENGRLIDEFSRLIKPVVYRNLFYRVREVVKISSSQLRKHGVSFRQAMDEFIQWCGEDAVYCTWGCMDMTQLQKNLDYFEITNPFECPLFYYDVQKLYSLQVLDGHDRIALDLAVSQLALETDRPFHRAVNDAYYTAMILKTLDPLKWKKMISVDYYRLPDRRQDEIYLVFERYSKFVSMEYATREALMNAPYIKSTVCFRCGHNVKKKIGWFCDSSRHYLSLSWCPVHGWVKGKLRIKKHGEGYFAVKTIKLTDAEEAKHIMEKYRIAKARHKVKG